MASRKPRSVHQRAMAPVLRTENLSWMTLLKVDLRRNKKLLQNQKKRNKKKRCSQSKSTVIKTKHGLSSESTHPFLGVTQHKKNNPTNAIVQVSRRVGARGSMTWWKLSWMLLLCSIQARIRKIIQNTWVFHLQISDLCSERKDTFLENTSPESVGEQPW